MQKMPMCVRNHAKNANEGSEPYFSDAVLVPVLSDCS